MNFNRYLKNLKKRESLRLANHLETLGAAFCQETGLKPTETVLVSTDTEAGREYWFVRKTERPNLEECHPDIRRLVELTVRWADLPAATHTEEEIELREFIKKYQEPDAGEKKD